MNKVTKEKMILYRLNRAEETIAEVQSHLENSYLHTAVNRIYYGIFYCFSACIARKFSNQKPWSTHGWVQQRIH